MTFFEAYLLFAVLPNMGGIFLLLGAAGGFALSVMWVHWFLEDTDNKDKAAALKKSTLACAFIILFWSLIPSESQIAKIFAAKLATSKQAQEFYGEAGDYMKQWLINQTEELKKENEK